METFCYKFGVVITLLWFSLLSQAVYTAILQAEAPEHEMCDTWVLL